MTRFDSDAAHEVSRETYAPLSDTWNRPPRVHFEASGHVMTACPPGASIRCELECDNASRVTIREAEPDALGWRHHIVDVTELVETRKAVHATGDDDITTETIAIASALYWSWWRAMDMRGETPGDER